MNEAAADALRALLTCRHPSPVGIMCTACGAAKSGSSGAWMRPPLLEALSLALAQSLGDRQPSCTQEGCVTPAIVTFVWPGRARAGACSEHALKVISIFRAMDLPVESLDMKLIGPEA